MLKILVKCGFHSEKFLGSFIASKHLRISYLQYHVRYKSNEDYWKDVGWKDLKKEPKMISEEALSKLNLKHNSVKRFGLWHSSIEIECPEKMKYRLTGMALEKIDSLDIAVKKMLKILTEKKLISNPTQLILPITSDPGKHTESVNDVMKTLGSGLCSEFGRLWLSSRPLAHIRTCSYCLQEIRREEIWKIILRSTHTSSDINGNNKMSVKRKHEVETVKVEVPLNTVKTNTRKIIKARRRKSVQQETSVPDPPVILQKGKAEMRGEVAVNSQLKVMEAPNTEIKENFAETKNESQPADISTSSELNLNVSKRELEAIERRYPHPKGTLHNIYSVVAQVLNDSAYRARISFRMVPVHAGKRSQNMWNCIYRLRWPYEAVFSSTMPSKAHAGKEAALQALHWLQMQGKLTKSGAPQMYSPSEIKKILRVPTDIVVKPSIIGEIDSVINYYEKNIQPLLDEIEREEEKAAEKDESINGVEDLFVNDELTSPITGLTNTKSDPKAIARRNELLYDRYLRRRSSCKEKSSEVLPIAEFKLQIVKLAEENKVLVIKGETGCGKSTQVPQYIMEHWESAMRGAHCNIIITQPRRISAISLANWVAHERHEKVGDVVGYQVRLKAELPKPPGGALLFCSSGILLRRLQTNPGLVGVNHVIIDEAHERDINTDMLLVLLRRALTLNPNLHLIIMSATINAELFQKYFDDAPSLHIPGFTYPVKSIFLEDMEVGRRVSKSSEYPIIDPNLIAGTIKWIHKNRPEGAILCFLPGWSDITSVSKLLDKQTDGSYEILPAHSRLSYAEQRRIFHIPPPGIRKIILATNIAETSITVNDVKYVIDAGAHKEERFNVHRGISSLDNQWVSKANVRQRKGRAGRVQPGECFHLYTREKYESLDEFPIPELLRVDLEQTVLDLKTYSQDEKAKEFLSEMPEPPSLQAVAQAVNELYLLGALDENERLTPLGRRIAMFGTHPKLSKALVFSAIFKCVSPMLTIATLLSSDADIFIGGLYNKENIRLTKKIYHPSSDHVSLAWLYQAWETISEESKMAGERFCQEKSTNSDSLRTISKLRRLFSDQLWESRMIDDMEEYKDLNAPCNKYAGNDELVKALFLSGTASLLFRRSWDIKNGRFIKSTNVLLTETGQRATVASQSVNFKRKDFPSPFLTYFRKVDSAERRIVTVQETSLLSPLSVLLFTDGVCETSKYVASENEDRWNNHTLLKLNRSKRDVLLVCETSVAQRLLKFREIMWNMINYFILKNGVEDDDERYRTMCSYQDRLLKILASLLYASGSVIEYDEDGNKRA